METVNLADWVRPKTFEEVAGNEKVVADLSTSIRNAATKKGKLPSTFLFSGPRGTGKTTMAFLVSRYLNCETHDACGTCQSCLDMNNDPRTHPDITFIDVGSKGKVDDMRLLQNYVNRSPRYNKRAIILDEAHALTGAAATSLLLTLEAPPPNTVFFLCTTNPEKLLPTIVSRAIAYKLQNIDIDDSISRMTEVVRALGLRSKSKAVREVTTECLRKIAEASNGHLRDALGLLQRYTSTLDSASDWSVDDVDAVLESTENAKTAVDFMIAFVGMDMHAVIKVLRSQTELRPLMHKLRWLAYYIIGDGAGSNKFQIPELREFLAQVRKKKTKYGLPLLIKLQQALIESEALMNSGIHESVALESKVCSLMVREHEGEDE